MSPKGKSPGESQIHVLEIAGNAIVGGMEKYVYYLAQHLPAENIKVTCLAPYESSFTGSLRHQGCEVYITPMNIDPTWRSIVFTNELVKRLGINLIHTHLPQAHVLGGLVGKVSDVPVLSTIHGMEINNQDLSISLTCGTYLTVVCQEAYFRALSFGIPEEDVWLVPNGVDLRTFHPVKSGANFRHTMGISEDTPLVGYVGRLSWEKGPDQFVMAASRIHRALPHVHFVMVGEGNLQDEIERMVQAEGLSEVFHLAGNWDNTWEVYPAFNLMAQTSRVEGMPFSLLEAMASGVPVMAFGVGGVPELVEVGSSGELAAVGDWAGLADASIKLLSKPDRLKLMGANARKLVENNYDLKNTIRNMAKIFNKLAGPPLGKDNLLHQEWHLKEKPAGDLVAIPPSSNLGKKNNKPA